MAKSKQRKTTKRRGRTTYDTEYRVKMLRTQLVNWEKDYFTYVLVTDGAGEPSISVYDTELFAFVQLAMPGSLVHHYDVCKTTYKILSRATYIVSNNMAVIPLTDSPDAKTTYMKNPKIKLFEALIVANAKEYPYFPIYHTQAKELGLVFGKPSDTMVSKELPELVEVLDLIKDDYRDWYDFFIEELRWTRSTDVDLEPEVAPLTYPVRERYFSEGEGDKQIFRAMSTHFILVDKKGNVEFVTPDTTAGVMIVDGVTTTIKKEDWVIPEHVDHFYRIYAGCSPVGADMRGICIQRYQVKN